MPHWHAMHAYGCDCQGTNAQVRVVNSLTNAVVIPGSHSASSASHESKPHAVLQPLQSPYPGQSLIVTSLYCNNNNNNNNHDNVYGAVIMTKVIARVHPVHLMNVV